jgi:hypothetical protein
VRRGDVQAELLDQAGEAGRLPFWQVQDEPRERGRVDDRVLERAFEAAPDEPGVERVVAVLDQHRTPGEAEEGAARVPELGGADQHRAVDVVAPLGIGVDGRPAVDQGVEKRKGANQLEALRPDLEHQEGGVACGLDVQGDELCVREQRLGAHLGRIDRDLLPGHRLGRAARLQEDRSLGHQINAKPLWAVAINEPAPAPSGQTRSHPL